jgi:hypothetical protein
MKKSSENYREQSNNDKDNEDKSNIGYKKPSPSKQGNHEDGYQENIYSSLDLLDSSYTDSATKTNGKSQLEL